MKARPALVVSVALAIAACERTPTAPTPPAAPNALTWSSCGPTDGPARTFIVGDATTSCADQPKYPTTTRYEIEIWEGAPLADVPLALHGTSGEARRCQAAACVPLANATLSFHADSDGTTLGTLTFTEGGVETTRAFRAVRCEVHVVCG